MITLIGSQWAALRAACNPAPICTQATHVNGLKEAGREGGRGREAHMEAKRGAGTEVGREVGREIDMEAGRERGKQVEGRE